MLKHIVNCVARLADLILSLDAKVLSFPGETFFKEACKSFNDSLQYLDKIEVKFIKVHPDAKLPEYNHPGEDTGLDIFVVEDTIIPAKGSAVVNTGLKVGYITPGYWFKIETRSGLGFKKGLHTHHGIVDNGYRGELGVKVYNLSDEDCEIKAGEKIAQLVFYPLIVVEPSFIDKPVESKRGEKGFGSSDKLWTYKIEYITESRKEPSTIRIRANSVDGAIDKLKRDFGEKVEILDYEVVE